MKKTVKRIVSLIMAVTMVVSAMVFTSFSASAATPNVSFSSSFRSGKYYSALSNVVLTGNPRTDIVNIAKSQVGYQEGSNSSKLSGTVRGNGNCTEYGRWYGLQDMWCAMFVSWCSAVAGVDTNIIPKHCFTPSGLSFFKNSGRAYSRSSVAAGKYTPQPGDIVYFKSSRNSNTTNHIGIVTKYSGTTLYTIEGNTSSATISTNGGAVASKSYSIYNTYIVYICKPNYSNTGLSGSATGAKISATTSTAVATTSSSSSTTKSTSTSKSTTTTTSSVTSGFSTTGNLKKGSSGTQVKYLQMNLIGLGYLNDVADGDFGTNTYNAVIKYQKAKGLSADGIAGSGTRSKIKSDVQALQNKLKSLGYYTGSADGIYGSATKTAVTKYQKAKGLSADGIAGTKTLASLNGKTNTSTSSSKTSTSTKTTPTIKVSSLVKTTSTLKKGSTGTQVKYLQMNLIGLGYLSGSADGIYGSGTQAAVKKYQKAKGLSADGIAGAKTLAKIKADVQALQTKLVTLGYLTGTVDCVYGSSTKSAVVKYQKAKGLSADGIAGSKTRSKLGI